MSWKEKQQTVAYKLGNDWYYGCWNCNNTKTVEEYIQFFYIQILFSKLFSFS